MLLNILRSSLLVVLCLSSLDDGRLRVGSLDCLALLPISWRDRALLCDRHIRSLDGSISVSVLCSGLQILDYRPLTLATTRLLDLGWLTCANVTAVSANHESVANAGVLPSVSGC